ncbi:hypothetical protein HPB49_010006 [Dermacentor silvarum]|uniref:Uncharacterized protein n=1 Tax=Dermacentor silvarum TaxID=543639 RepID=A0ACB8DIQ9_DERSI|nr:hypothetical protein HPB49_010006 [Dermacentor silvarum]
MADDMNGSASSAKHAALLMLLDSDSSESESSSSDTSDFTDSDSDAETAAYEREFDSMFRIHAKRPKIVGFIEDVVRQYSDDEFRRHFRLARPVAEKLIAEFAASSMCPSRTNGGVPAKSAETHILSFIWYAANKTCMRNVASRFDLSESSVHRILHRVAHFLLTLGPSLIKFPADLENLTRSIEKMSFTVSFELPKCQQFYLCAFIIGTDCACVVIRRGSVAKRCQYCRGTASGMTEERNSGHTPPAFTSFSAEANPRTIREGAAGASSTSDYYPTISDEAWAYPLNMLNSPSDAIYVTEYVDMNENGSTAYRLPLISSDDIEANLSTGHASMEESAIFEDDARIPNDTWGGQRNTWYYLADVTSTVYGRCCTAQVHLALDVIEEVLRYRIR